MLFLGLCYFPTVTWPRRREVTSTRHSRGKGNSLSAVQTMLQACRKLAEPSPFSAGYTLVLLSHTFCTFSFSICLDLSLSSRVSVDDMQNPRETTEICRFICNFRLRILIFIQLHESISNLLFHRIQSSGIDIYSSSISEIE